MNVMNTRSLRIAPRPGVLFRRTAPEESLAVIGSPEVSQKDLRGRHRLAFIGLFLFTLLMYSRPHEVMPEVFGVLPLPKIVAISAILIYIGSKLSAGERVINWLTEIKMFALLWMLGLLFTPVAASPADSINVLFDPLIKVLLIFIVQINLIDTRPRFRSMVGIMVFCEALYAVSAINTFLT